MTSLSRREFLKASAAVATTIGAAAAHAQTSPGDTLRIGLIGCGGRGTGAAAQALAADPSVKLVAMADAFGDRLQSSLGTLKKQAAIAAKLDRHGRCGRAGTAHGGPRGSGW